LAFSNLLKFSGFHIVEVLKNLAFSNLLKFSGFYVIEVLKNLLQIADSLVEIMR